MDATKGFVVPAGGGKHLDMAAPGRFSALKLVGHETNESIMLFEETVPVGTKSLFHLHRDSDEVAWVLAGEITFKIGDEITVGGPGTCAFFPRNVPMPGRAPAAKPAASCSCTPRRPPAATSRSSRTTARPTTTNASSSASATTGKSSVQTRSDGGCGVGPNR